MEWEKEEGYKRHNIVQCNVYTKPKIYNTSK